MMCWMMVTAVILTGEAVCACAEEPRPLPSSNPASAVKPLVELRVRMIERLREADQGDSSGTTRRVLNPAELKEFLNELAKDGKAKIVAEPTLQLGLGKEGLFRSGREIAFKVPSPNPGKPPTEEKMFFGTALDATVTMPKPGLLSVLVRCEQSEPIETGMEGPPRMNKAAVDTRVELQSGQTMVLEGLVCRHQTTTMETRYPVVGEIPIIGRRLFAHRRTETHAIELVVLITATLIEPPAQ